MPENNDEIIVLRELSPNEEMFWNEAIKRFQRNENWVDFNSFVFRFFSLILFSPNKQPLSEDSLYRALKVLLDKLKARQCPELSAASDYISKKITIQYGAEMTAIN